MALTIVQQPAASAFTGNPMNIIIESDNLRDGSSDLRLGFKIGLILEIDTDQSYAAPVWEEKARFEVSSFESVSGTGIGRAEFNIQHIMKSLIRKFHQAPQPIYSVANGSAYDFFSKNQLYYRFKYYETYQTAATIDPATLDDSGILMAQLGGISGHLANKFGTNDIQNFSNQFLSQHPSRKRSQDFMPEFVSFNTGATPPATLIISLKITYTDGFVSSNPIYTFNSLEPYKTITLAAGYTQLDIGSYDPAREVKSWCILTPGLESPIFVRDCRYFDCGNILLYENSMGCWETLYTTGKYSLDLEVEGIKALSLPDIDRSPQFDIRTVVCEKTGTQKYTGRTGYVSKEMAAYLQNFLLSEEIYWLVSYTGTTYESRPIVLDDSDYPVSECWQYLYSFTFDFELAHSMSNYDKTLPLR